MNRLLFFKNRKLDWYTVLLILLTAVLMVRACFGFSWTDESFYLTFSDRLLKGDRLIVNEWHPAQLYAVMLLPVQWMYQRLVGTQGIYLFIRQLYLVGAFGTAIWTYRTFRKHIPPMAAFFCAGAYLLYSKSNVWGGSYYNIFLTCLLLSLNLVLIAREKGAGKGSFSWIFNGIALAGAVLCMPYFAPFVVLGLLLAFWLLKDYRRGVLLTALGIGIAAAIFLIAFLRDIPAVLKGISYVLTDGEHQSGAMSNLFGAIVEVLQIFYREMLLSLLAAGILCMGDRSVYRQQCQYLCGSILLMASGWMFIRLLHEVPGYAFFTLAIACVPILARCYLRREINPFGLYIRIVGVCMALAFAMGSNTMSNAMSMGVVVYLIGVLFQLYSLPEAVPGKKFSFQTLISLLMTAALAFTLFSRITLVNRDGALNTLNTRISSGPAAGLYTTQEHAAVYGELVDMIDALNQTYTRDNTVFITKVLPWGYLATDFSYGTPTAWRTELSSSRLEAYYTLYPEKLPTIVIVLKDTVGDYPGAPAPNENTRAGFLWEWMQENCYQVQKWPQATVYISPNAGIR